jgi:predicted transcriptional regulator
MPVSNTKAKKSTIKTFRLDPGILRQFQILQEELNLNRTEVLYKAIEDLLIKVEKERQVHPLAKFCGIMSEEQGQEIDDILAEDRKRRIAMQIKRDAELEKLFD